MAGLDLPIITESTNEYYRNIYADPDLGPIFKGINMVVLRTHVSYFINQLAMFDMPMTERQLHYLHRTHAPLIVKHNITQRHYDLMLAYLTDAMRANGAQESHLEMVQTKLLPLRNIFPPAQQSEDGCVEVQELTDVQQAHTDASCAHGGGKQRSSKQSAAASSKPSWLGHIFHSFGCHPRLAAQ